MAKHSIQGTGIQGRVDALLDDGVTYAEVCKRTGLSLSAVGRYAISRRSEIAKLIGSGPTVTDVVSRLLEAADDAQELRRQARIVGTPVHRARAIRAEVEVLTKLRAELGITSTTMADTAEEVEELVQAVIAHANASPQNARALLETFRGYPTLSGAVIALEERTGNQK